MLEVKNGLHFAPVNETLRFIHIRHMRDEVEVLSRDEARYKFAAGDAVVEIVNGNGHMRHVGRHGVAEHKHLNDRHNEYNGSHPRVSKDVDEFLDQHALDSFEHLFTW
jgi:hypothetical protein